MKRFIRRLTDAPKTKNTEPIEFVYLVSFVWYQDDSGRKWPSYVTSRGTFTATPETTYKQIQNAAIDIAKEESNAGFRKDGSDVRIPEDAIVLAISINRNVTAEEI